MRTRILLAFVLAALGCGSSESQSTSSSGDGTQCVQAGGMCGCAGGCNPGYHPAAPPLLDQCPQPCDLCGACSQQCCLPDADAGSDAGDGG